MECKVHTTIGESPLTVSLPEKSCAEDVVIAACRKLEIKPITRLLFALRLRGCTLFLRDGEQVDHQKEYELRVRYQVSSLSQLSTLDRVAYEYFFRQARNDVLHNRVPEIQYELHKTALLGLGVVDMYRAIQEEGKLLTEVENNSKKYIPKVIYKKHKFFLKKPVHNTLEPWCQQQPPQSVDLIKSSYLEQLSRLTPNYLSEEYAVTYTQFGEMSAKGRVQIAPFHHSQPGLRFYDEITDKWVHICKIDQLIFLGRKTTNCDVQINTNCDVQINRKNGVPIDLCFRTADETSSFISGVGGYYRLMVKWTFDLSQKDPTPSLQRLYAITCHGPVNGEFAYYKLSTEADQRHGCYILRQCAVKYDEYYIDYCTDKRICKSCQVVYKGSCYELTLNGETHSFSSLKELVRSFNDPDGEMYLKDCIAPSEHDKSQLLLCGEPYRSKDTINATQLQDMMKHHPSPRCINNREIFRNKQVSGIGGITVTYRANWLIDKKRVAIAFKTLIQEKTDSHLKDFIELANKWAGVQSNSVVKLYGVTLMSPSALVMEYLEYGPLDAFLREKKDKKLKLVQLIMAANGVARALLDLSEAGCVHGRLRCSKVLVESYGHNFLTVKVSDPGMHTYTDRDIHWIPVELYSNLSLARRSTAADVWAFGTTLWEIFSYGKSPNECNPQLRPMAYEKGERLEWPDNCPRDLWLVILSCWAADPHRRATPQVIMRDIWWLLHRETMNARRGYEQLDETTTNNHVVNGVNDTSPCTKVYSDIDKVYDETSLTSSETVDDTLSLPSSSFFPNIVYTSDIFSSSAAHPMQWIFGVGPECEVTVENNIGQGHYGEVYKGILERKDNAQPPQVVAIKKLKEKGNEDGDEKQRKEEKKKRREFLEDLQKEINVMKSLVHQNIVQIIGVCGETEIMIVMPYLPHGSLETYLNIYRHTTTPAHLLKYAKDVASGMEYLSSKHVVHRDLAARNILVKDPCNVQISDFGLARFTSEDDKYHIINRNRALPVNWYSPEAAVRGVFSSKSDVWSYGVTAWEMFGYCSQTLVEFDQTQPEKRAECFQIPNDCDADVYTKLMLPCWNLEPDDRPTFIDLIRVCEQLSMKIGTV